MQSCVCVCKQKSRITSAPVCASHTLPCLSSPPHGECAAGCSLMRLPATSIRPGFNPRKDLAVKLSSSSMASPRSYSNTAHVSMWKWKHQSRRDASVPEGWPSWSSEWRWDGEEADRKAWTDQDEERSNKKRGFFLFAWILITVCFLVMWEEVNITFSSVILQ